MKTEISLVGGPDHLLHETNSLSMGELLGQNKVRKVILLIQKVKIIKVKIIVLPLLKLLWE